MPGPEALPSLVEQHERTTGCPCTFEVTGQPLPLAPDAQLAVYRAAQEALANSRKHATGAAVAVRLTWGDDSAVVEVVDSGGNDVHRTLHASGTGAGLTGLAERAALAGGRLDAGPVADGFRVALSVPAQRRAQEAP